MKNYSYHVSGRNDDGGDDDVVGEDGDCIRRPFRSTEENFQIHDPAHAGFLYPSQEV